MAAAQTAEQKAATQKAADEAKAAEEQKAADEKAKAEQAAAEIETERVEAVEAAAITLQVVGPVAVLPLKSGGERYVYRGTPVGDEFTDEGIEHAKSVGLVAEPKQ